MKQPSVHQAIRPQLEQAMRHLEHLAERHAADRHRSVRLVTPKADSAVATITLSAEEATILLAAAHVALLLGAADG